MKSRIRSFLKSKPIIRNFARNFRIKIQGDLGWSKVRLPETEATTKKILIATSFGGEIAITNVESLIAGALKVRGVEVHALLCDGLPACQLCDTTRFNSDDDFITSGLPVSVCKNCFKGGQRIFEAMKIKLHKLSDYLEADDENYVDSVLEKTDFSNIDELKKVYIDDSAIGEHAVAGACRYFAKADISDEPYKINILEKYFRSAVLVDIATSRLLESEKYECAVFNHGIYVPQGVIAEACKKHDVRIVNWNTAYRKQCFIFSHGETYHHELMKEPTEVWENMVWDASKSERIQSYISSRSEGKNDWIKFNDSPLDDVSVVRNELGISEGQKVVGMYTNVLWDAQLHYPDNVFENMLDWIVKTVGYFVERPDLVLVIRVHPAELTGHLKSRQLVSETISKMFPDLPQNIKIIGPDNKLNSYSLAKLCDTVIIYGTKTGVELSSMGIPVIVAGEAWLRGKNIALDITSQHEYFNHLDQLPICKRLDDQQIIRAQKYAYHFFFRRMIPLSNIHPTGGIPQYKLFVESGESLKPGYCRGLDVICDGIINQSEFVYDQ